MKTYARKKPLAKSTRIRVYKKALEIYEKEVHIPKLRNSGPRHQYGVCIAIDRALEVLNINNNMDDWGFYYPGSPYDTSTIERFWPEFASYRPFLMLGYWWPYDDTTTRLDILTRLSKGLSKGE